MIAIIAVFLFIVWLLGIFRVYDIGWFFHMFLIASIMLIFVRAMRTRRLETAKIMEDAELPETEARQVRRIMEKNKLDEKEAVELFKIRSGLDLVVDDGHLLQTAAGQVEKVMQKNKLNEREAIGLLSFRLKLRH
jgi:hypothetical protein